MLYLLSPLAVVMLPVVVVPIVPVVPVVAVIAVDDDGITPSIKKSILYRTTKTQKKFIRNT